MEQEFPEDLPLIWQRLTQALGLIAGLLLLVLMVLVVIDIAARSAGLFSIYGIIELSRSTLLLVACLGQAWVFAVRGHIVVDLVTSGLPDGVVKYLNAFGYVVAGLGAAFIAWYMVLGGWEMHQVGERSETLHLSPLVFRIPAAFGLVVSSVTALMVALGMLRRTHEDGKDAA
jgi:TRAP-type C4-dicarboxylate transport system permease small subunit